MRKTLIAGAMILTLGLTDPVSMASASIPVPTEEPAITARCPELTGCVIPEPDPDPQINPNLPAGGGEITIGLPDPCEDFGIFCPPDPDPEVDPTLPGSGIVTTDPPCIEDILGNNCNPGGGDGGGDGDEDPDPEEPTEPEEPTPGDGDQPEPGDGEQPDDPEQPGDDPDEPADPGDDPGDGPADNPTDDGTVDLDTPRPGVPNFTG